MCVYPGKPEESGRPEESSRPEESGKPVYPDMGNIIQRMISKNE